MTNEILGMTIGFVFGLASGGRSTWRLGCFRVRESCEATDSVSDMITSSAVVLVRASKLFDVGTTKSDDSVDGLCFLMTGEESGFGMKLDVRGRRLKSFVDCVPRSFGGNIDDDDDDEPLPAAIFSLLLLRIFIFISPKTHREDVCEV